MTRFSPARWFRAPFVVIGLGALALASLSAYSVVAQTGAAAKTAAATQKAPTAKAPATTPPSVLSAPKTAAPANTRAGSAAPIAAQSAAPKAVLPTPPAAKRPTPAAPLPAPAATAPQKADGTAKAAAPPATAPAAAKSAAQAKTTAPAATGESADAPAARPKLEKYTLTYKFKPGDVLKTKVTQQTRVETTISGTAQGAEIATVSYKSWRVTKVDEQGNFTFETQWDAIDMRQKMTGRDEVRYNSATDKTAPPGYESTAAMIGVPLSLLTIDPRGKIINRESKNEQSEKLHENGTYMAKQQVLVPLPAEPVVLGQPWSTPTEIKVTIDETPRVIQARHRYQIDKVEGNVALIAYETVLPPISDPETRSQVIQQLGRGTVRFDMTAGRVLSQVTDVDERVLGFHGMNSSIHFLSRFTEELIPEKTKATTASASTPTKQPTTQPKVSAQAPPHAKTPAAANTTAKAPTAAKAAAPAAIAAPKSTTPPPRATAKAASPATKAPTIQPSKPSTAQNPTQAKKK